MPAVKSRGRGGTQPAKYPWHHMEVGDSFLFPASVGRGAYAAAIQASRKDRKYVAYRTDEGFRCWRVA